jgi:hypothetical protein
VLILGPHDRGIGVTQLTMPLLRDSRKWKIVIAHFMQVGVF